MVTLVCVCIAEFFFNVNQQQETLSHTIKTDNGGGATGRQCIMNYEIHMVSNNFRRIRNVSKSDLSSSCLSVSWNKSNSTGRIFIKFCISGLFQNLSRKFKFH